MAVLVYFFSCVPDKFSLFIWMHVSRSLVLPTGANHTPQAVGQPSPLDCFVAEALLGSEDTRVCSIHADLNSDTQS